MLSKYKMFVYIIIVSGIFEAIQVKHALQKNLLEDYDIDKPKNLILSLILHHTFYSKILKID